MLIFETILILLFGATILAELANRWNVPYPVLLAVGGACVALLPLSTLPPLEISPELILALFVAPILLNAAHDASLRDLRENWLPIMSLVLIAVGITTVAVACVAHWLIPGMPWGAAIALGALLAPPDAVAAMAVLSKLNLPHRIRTVLEGESLLNDASSLLIYKLAVGAVLAGSFQATHVLPTFALVVFGSVVVGWVLARLVGKLMKYVSDTPILVILQFITTFGVWLLAEHTGLSGIITIVVFGFAMTRYSMLEMPARVRVSAFAIWESATFVLNVLAFTLVGLQIRPILANKENEQLFWISPLILGVVIVIRLLWMMVYTLIRKYGTSSPVSAKSGVLIAWSGMRGIVTLAAAMALPATFPYRDFIQLTSFVVVLGTLLIQGLTLRPLLAFLKLPADEKVDDEVAITRSAALSAALMTLESNESTAAKRLRQEYSNALRRTLQAKDPHGSADNTLRRQAAKAGRRAIFDLHSKGEIGDEAYRQVEQELDWLELSATPQNTSVDSVNAERQ